MNSNKQPVGQTCSPCSSADLYEHHCLFVNRQSKYRLINDDDNKNNNNKVIGMIDDGDNDIMNSCSTPPIIDVVIGRCTWVIITFGHVVTV